MQYQATYRRVILTILVLVVCSAGLAACGQLLSRLVPTPTLAPTSTPRPSPTAEPLGGNLTVRLAQDIPDLRPWQPQSRGEELVSSLLYSGLMRLDEKLRPQPDLASEWEASLSGRVLTFTLRTNLFWHDGEPLDARDVRFTIERLRGLPITSTALLNDLRHIAAVSTPTNHTVVISLTERFAPLLARLTLPILPRHALENRDLETTNFWDVPIGSGPFKLDNRQPGQSIVLSRFERFHRGAPLLERVAFVGAADTEITMKALQDGNLLLGELPWNTMERIDAMDDLHTGFYPENGFYFLAFNLREGRPFADVRVRRALALALDLPRLVETATKRQGISIASSVAPGSWADLTPPPTGATDLAAARELLNGAGWILPEGATIRQRDGTNFAARLFVRGDDERRLVAAQRIAEAGASIGLQIDVEAADFSTVIMSKYVPPYDFDLLIGSWVSGPGDATFGDYMYYDPDDFALFHSSQINQGVMDTRSTRNIVAFSDTAYDNQSQAARQIYNTDERIPIYQQTQERVSALLPYLYLWVDRIPVALNKRVTTIDGPVNLDTPLYFWNIERWYVEEPGE